MSPFFTALRTAEIYTLSLHDALPIFSTPRRICCSMVAEPSRSLGPPNRATPNSSSAGAAIAGRALEERSEEHTSELQSPDHLVCRLLLEKKKNKPLKTAKTALTGYRQ